MDIFIWVIVWLIFCILVGVYASSKGRSGIGYFFISALLSPLIGIIIAALSSPNQEKVDSKKIKSGSMKKCPYCAELVKSEAVVCKHCSKELPKQPVIDINTVVNQEDYRTLGDLIEYANKPGYSKAKYLLGMLYLKGDLVEANHHYAVKWIKLAAEEGYQDAVHKIQTIPE